MVMCIDLGREKKVKPCQNDVPDIKEEEESGERARGVLASPEKVVDAGGRSKAPGLRVHGPVAIEHSGVGQKEEEVVVLK